MVAEVIPSQFIASATYNALLTVLPSCRQFTRKASRKSIGYDLSSGLFCHSCLTMLQLNKASANERVCELANSTFTTAKDGGGYSSSDILA